MRKVLLSSLCLLFIIVYISCQKHASLTPSSVAEQQVVQWLNTVKLSIFADTNRAKIQSLQENLDFSNLRLEGLRDGEKFIVVPIKTTKIVPATPNATNCLVLILNSAGKIRKGSIGQYTDDLARAGSIPLNFFHTMYNGMPPANNPRLAYYSVTGRFLFDFTFKSGKLYSSSYLSSGDALHKIKVADVDCTDWYLVTTITYADGSQTVDEQYLFTTCDDGAGGGDPSQPFCGDGTVGLGEDDDTPVTTVYGWHVADDGDAWEVNSFENISGVRSSSCTGSGGYFTSAFHNRSTGGGPGSSWVETSCPVTLTGNPKTSGSAHMTGVVVSMGGNAYINETGPFNFHMVFP